MSIKSKIIISFLLVVSVFSAMAQDSAVIKRWSYRTAYLMPKGRWESGLLQPFRYGISDRIEIFSSILSLPLMPNAGVKLSHGEVAGFKLAGEYIASCPSPLLNFLSRSGTGGFLSPQYDFPFILSLSGTIAASRMICKPMLLTIRTGIAVALRGDSINQQATIDLPVVYPRTAHYYKGVSIKLAADVKGPICRRWNYEEGFQMFIITRKENNFFVENTGYMMWTLSKAFRIKGGYNLSYGTYPFGNRWQLWPALGILFGSKE